MPLMVESIPAEIRDHLARAGELSDAARTWIDLLITDPFLSLEALNAPLRKASLFQTTADVWRYLAERAYLKGREDQSAACEPWAPPLAPCRHSQDASMTRVTVARQLGSPNEPL